jgi:hypothetical protein
MPNKIVILEDNVERQAAMQRYLDERFDEFEAVFFRAVAPAVEYCERHLADIILIALDHDLELIATSNGRCLDPGTGREVADYLAGRKPVCPVVIHTSNGAAGDGMEMVLQDARWQTHRVVPVDDLDWIPTAWLRAVRRAIAKKPAARQ